MKYYACRFENIPQHLAPEPDTEFICWGAPVRIPGLRSDHPYVVGFLSSYFGFVIRGAFPELDDAKAFAAAIAPDSSPLERVFVHDPLPCEIPPVSTLYEPASMDTGDLQ